MNAKISCTGLVAVLALAAAPVLGDYTSIQHNLFDMEPDTSFNPGTGVFSIAAVNQGLLTLNDPTALVGVVSNVELNLVTNFNTILPSGQAKFVGGTLSLSFDFDPAGAAPLDSHNISGPINGMLFEISQVGPNSRIDGLGRWLAANVDLPGSNNWPDGDDFSSIDSLSIAFNQNLSTFDWTSDLTGRVESLYSLFPDNRAIPEPASLSLLAVGAIGLLRRRR